MLIIKNIVMCINADVFLGEISKYLLNQLFKRTVNFYQKMHHWFSWKILKNLDLQLITFLPYSEFNMNKISMTK